MRPLHAIRAAALTLGLLTGLAGLLDIASTGAVAQNRALWYESGGAAIGGYDPVAYFETGQPTLGDAALVHSWGDVVWRFATEEHRAAFRLDPEAYAPQYGGFDALAMTLGGAGNIDPNWFQIEQGKLYLFLSRDRRTTWRGRKARNISRADDNWARIQEVLIVRREGATQRCGDAYSKRQFADAQELCLERAEEGDRRAQTMLGIAFADAPVQQRNYELAAEWLNRAAAQDQRDAQWRLAGLYYRGRGVRRDLEEALFWYEEAARNGHIESRTTLGDMYRDGIGTPVDLVRAYQWYNLGAIESQKALEERDKLRRLIKPAQLLEAEMRSIEWLQQNPSR